MKKLFVSVVLFVSSFGLSAQDAFIIGNNGQTGIHEQYLTNEWYDNLFLGGGVGISTRFTIGRNSDIITPYINPSINIYLLKWFTPRIGARLGYVGFNGREGLASYTPFAINHSALPFKPDGSDKFVEASNTPGVLHYGSFMITGDLMWNIRNTFGGFKKDRFYTISAYATGGYLKLYDNKIEGRKGLFSKNYDREFVIGAGAFNTFRLTDRLVATADLRFASHASRYRTRSGVWTISPSLTFGVSYNLYRTTWTDAMAVKTTVDEAVQAAEAAEKKVEEVKLKNVELEKKVERLTIELGGFNDSTEIVHVDAISYAKLKERAESADIVVYFYINQSTLNFSEVYHLQTFVQEALAKDPDFKFNVIGSADKGTGYAGYNEALSRSRALFIKDYLIRKFNVKPSNIKVSSVVTDKHLDGAYDRCAIIERAQ